MISKASAPFSMLLNSGLRPSGPVRIVLVPRNHRRTIDPMQMQMETRQLWLRLSAFNTKMMQWAAAAVGECVGDLKTRQCCKEAMEGGLHPGEDGGDGLAVLPRHTKVLVTGNNRTKSVLVGLQGVVTKAVGLGGWHWLMLTNGDEVKLQRNALSVIEAPSGHKENVGDDDDNEDNPFSRETSLDKNYPRNSFRVHSRKPALPTSSNPGVRVAQCGNSFHKTEGRDEGSGLSSKCLPSVNLSKLETAILKRYRSHFKLVEVGPNSSKEQLVDAVVRHFMSQELDEGQVIMGFMQAAKRLRA